MNIKMYKIGLNAVFGHIKSFFFSSEYTTSERNTLFNLRISSVKNETLTSLCYVMSIMLDSNQDLM